MNANNNETVTPTAEELDNIRRLREEGAVGGGRTAGGEEVHGVSVGCGRDHMAMMIA